MTLKAYYNENDPFAAAWLRNLITEGHIASGDVDERSIEDVTPNDLAGYTQCHFFAGIGGWSLAARRAGWPDSRPLWTGSCPCQPFSAAGKGLGFVDERHLWPAWCWLIGECRPDIIRGEQVARGGGLEWFDLVASDLEHQGYAVTAAVVPAAGFGGAHIRERLYFMADADDAGSQGWGQRGVWSADQRAAGPDGLAGRLADAAGSRPTEAWQHKRGFPQLPARPAEHGGVVRPADPVNGFWRGADWLLCRDGKWRPVEPGTFPLAHGVSNRVGLLRGYGNAIHIPTAEAWLRATI